MMPYINETDFVIKNKELVYPEIVTDGLQLYYDAKGKRDTDYHRDTMLDMSGNGNHGQLHNFAYEKHSGYKDGLVFDYIDDKLVRPALNLKPNDFTFMLNGNIISFSPDGTVKRVQDGKVIESKELGSTPNAQDLIDCIEYKGNILGDMENIIDGLYKTEVLSGTEIYTDKADDSVVHVEIDGKSYQDGVPTPDSPSEIHSLNDFDVVSSVGKRNLLIDKENGNYALYSNDSSIYPTRHKSYEDYDSITLRDGPNLSTFSREFFTLEKDKEYTFSMYVYSPVKLDLRLQRRGDWTTVPANTWTRLSHTLIGAGESFRLLSLYSRSAEALNHEIFYNRIKLEEGEISNYSPAPEDITEDINHPLINKIDLSLGEPLRNVGDVKDRLFRDSDGLWKVERNVELIHPEDGTKTIEETYGVLDSPFYEILPQDDQDKLNNLRSFEDSNYVYATLPGRSNVLSERLKPTLHVRFLYNNWYKEDRVINNLMIYNRALTNEEMLQNYKMIKRRWGM